MTRRYSPAMPARQSSLPLLWLLSDARNDSGLEAALAVLPPGSGFVFRHYHLPAAGRAARFATLAEVAHRAGHLVVLSGDAELARQSGADGVYGEPSRIAHGAGLIRLATAHGEEDLAAAADAGADAAFLSPVFPTRSHNEAQPLGIERFRALAQRSPIPVIALGGMTAARARELDWPRWGAIDGLVPPHSA